LSVEGQSECVVDLDRYGRQESKEEGREGGKGGKQKGLRTKGDFRNMRIFLILCRRGVAHSKESAYTERREKAKGSEDET